jgi:membrane protease YdiL (CAAX protease family)
VRRPAAETGTLLAYLFVIAGFLTWGLEALGKISAMPRVHETAVLVSKVAVFVAVPAALMAALHGYRFSDWARISFDRMHVRAAWRMAAAMVIFQAVFGRGLVDIQRAGIGIGLLLAAVPAVFAWLLIEVGLVEEFFFRVLLQSRLAALLKSEVGGVVVASLLFGLAHAPGLYFRTSRTMEALGPNPPWYMAVGYSIVVTSVAGFFLGTLWARTKNLGLVMFVHAAGDLLQGIVPALQTWGFLPPR